MAHSDSEDEGIDDVEFDDGDDDDNIEDDFLTALEGDLQAAADDGSDAEDVESDTDDSEGASDEDDADEDEQRQPLHPQPSREHASEGERAHSQDPTLPSNAPSPQRESPPARSPSPIHQRPLTPAHARRAQLLADIRWPRSFTVEAVCAIPHPVPTHSLAASFCMSHLLTGSDDGYIRDYDIFAAVNGKVFLTAPQRHHCNVMEGLMKSAPLKSWWENPADMKLVTAPADETPLCAPYSLLMHSDALWALAGTDQGHINLFTVRHDPGRLCHVMHGHRGPVSSMSMQHDEKGFFSAGWDGEALQWDLNTGQIVRTFTSHGAQLTVVAVKPLSSDFHGNPWSGPPFSSHTARPTDSDTKFTPAGTQQRALPPVPSVSAGTESQKMEINGHTSAPTGLPPPSSTAPGSRAIRQEEEEEEDMKSETSFDPLFDDEPDAAGPGGRRSRAPSQSHPQAPSHLAAQPPLSQPQRSVSAAIAPKNAPPILDPATYATFSPDVLMTASIDGQVVLWDRRVHSPGKGVGRLWMSEKTPPWCVSACWSADGSQIYAGRRNGTIDIWDVRQMGTAAFGTPRVLKVLRNPVSSGVVSCVVAFPDGRHLACASIDNIRLWNVAEAGEPDASGKVKSGVQFKIIPGHHGGFVSQMLVDRAARFMVSASSNRGWHGESTRTVFVHEIKHLF